MTQAPPGFRCHRRDGALLVVAEDFESDVLELGLFEYPERAVRGSDQQPAGPAEHGGSGRSRNAIVGLPGRPERLQLRPFQHGGWLRSLLRERLANPQRPVAELAAAADLAANGAPVARCVFALAFRRGPVHWNALVGSVHEEATCDGIVFFAASPARERVHAAAAATGRALRAFHDAGGRHADLHLGNILLRERGGESEIVFIDLDRARVAPAVPAWRRAAEISRLYRSLYKRGALEATTPEVTRHFFDAYCDRDANLRAALLARLPRERLRVALHRAGYRVRPSAR